MPPYPEFFNHVKLPSYLGCAAEMLMDRCFLKVSSAAAASPLRWAHLKCSRTKTCLGWARLRLHLHAFAHAVPSTGTALPWPTYLTLTQSCPLLSSFLWSCRLCAITKPCTFLSVIPFTLNSNICFYAWLPPHTRLLATQGQGFCFNSTFHSLDFKYPLYLHDSPVNTTSQTLPWECTNLSHPHISSFLVQAPSSLTRSTAKTS